MVVQFLDIEEAFTEGSTPEECAFNAAEVLTSILEQRLADGAEIPLPGKHGRKPTASPSAAVQTAILLRVTRHEPEPEEKKKSQSAGGTPAVPGDSGPGRSPHPKNIGNPITPTIFGRYRSRS